MELRPLLLTAAITAASSMVLSGGVSPSVTIMTCEPVIVCVWSHISVFSANLSVSWSFWQLLRPTSIVYPSDDLYSIGGSAFGGFALLPPERI